MKPTIHLAILLALWTCLGHGMDNKNANEVFQRNLFSWIKNSSKESSSSRTMPDADRNSQNPEPDLMPDEGKKIIEILNDPTQASPPNRILVIGNHRVDKILQKIARDIQASDKYCDATNLLKCYESAQQSAMQESVLKNLISPTIEHALNEKKKRAILVITNFHVLYSKKNTQSIQDLMKALASKQYPDLKLPLIMIFHCINPATIEGAYVINAPSPNPSYKPNPFERKEIIKRLFENSDLDNELHITRLASTTENHSIRTIEAAVNQYRAWMPEYRSRYYKIRFDPNYDRNNRRDMDTDPYDNDYDDLAS